MDLQPEQVTHYGDELLDRIATQFSVLELLASADGTEIVQWNIKKGGQIVSSLADDDPDKYEFFYIVEGRLTGECEGRAVDLRAGDILTMRAMRIGLNLLADKDTSFIYITSRPEFHTISYHVSELTELAKDVEKQYRYEPGRYERIKSMSVFVGRQMGLRDAAIYRLAYAGLLHDVGKSELFPQFSAKRGTLTPEEKQRVMQSHPTIGRKLVEKTSLHDVGQAIEQHRELLDGSGYPFGLRGTQIVIEAQIVGVAVAFEDLTTAPPHGAGKSPAAALAALRRDGGTLYDPKIIDALAAVLEKGDPR